jgi:molecular chaperone GrpE
MTDQPITPEPVEPQVEAAVPDNPPPVVDSMPSLEESLRTAELKAAEHYDAWLRAKAETENVRRRAAEDAIKERKFAAEKFAAAMLPVKDSLEAALGVDNASLETLRSGVELTLKQLQQAFQSASLAEVDPMGERFDPNRHQAISMVEAEAEPNTVVQVLQKGYLLHERVIRPAMVIVAKPKAQ